MAEYLEYARGLHRELEEFLSETGIKLQPSLQLVACGFDPQHYVPASSLEAHARLRHRAKHYSTAQSHAFFYRRDDPNNVDAKTNASHNEPLVDGLPGDDGDSLVDSQTPLAQDGVLASLQVVAKDSSELYAAVRTWRRIPRAFAQLGLSGDVAVDRMKLERWIKSELARLQELAPDTVDGEMVEYVLGLLEHPEFCHPDLVVVELEEFLGSGEARTFVAALWKFMIVDVGLRVLPTAAPTAVTSVPSVTEKLAPVNGTEGVRATSTDSTTPVNSDYKRRRPSYRAKSTRAGPYDMMREILAKPMAQLSEDTGRELVELPARSDDSSKHTGAQKPWGRAVAKDWSECTDSLRVRDMGRESHRDPQANRRRSPPRRPETHSRRRSRSRSRDRHERRDQDRHRDLDRDRKRSRHGDHERDRGDDRDRERGRHRDYDRHQRRSRHRS